MYPMLFYVLGIRNFEDPKIKLLSWAADSSVSWPQCLLRHAWTLTWGRPMSRDQHHVLSTWPSAADRRGGSLFRRPLKGASPFHNIARATERATTGHQWTRYGRLGWLGARDPFKRHFSTGPAGGFGWLGGRAAVRPGCPAPGGSLLRVVAAGVRIVLLKK
jgi:hypothetical protein